MAFNVNEFKGALSGGGARPSLFEASISGPTFAEDIRFHCRATSIPQSTLGTVIVPYFGRQVKLAGNRTFDDWTVTIINDEDFAIRNAFESWSNQINSHIGNTQATGPDKAGYGCTGLVFQFGKDGSPLGSPWVFNGIYPVAISPIDLSWDAEAVEEFTVTFAYDWWEHGGSTS